MTRPLCVCVCGCADASRENEDPTKSNQRMILLQMLLLIALTENRAPRTCVPWPGRAPAPDAVSSARPCARHCCGSCIDRSEDPTNSAAVPHRSRASSSPSGADRSWSAAARRELDLWGGGGVGGGAVYEK